MRSAYFCLSMATILSSLTVSAEIGGIKVPSRTLELPFEDDFTLDSCPAGSVRQEGTNDCHPLGGESPCGKSMVFVQDTENPDFGTCVCKYGRESDCTGKPVGYWKEANQCYPLFEQRPCKKGEWLVPTTGNDSNRTLECQQSLCNVTLSSDILLPSPVFTFTLNGTCYETNKQSFCDKDEIAAFIGNDYEPKCISASIKKKYCYISELSITKLLGPQL
ncbi:unnamed protein product [Allacma fusca]|uniref:DUF4789 domain-containing protein n=1 Tax=Allacma fusca TaxID=39272 RepID=A0A8J2KUA9_9HEXA|nr:unnamed protein product [Allacma fusca]